MKKIDEDIKSGQLKNAYLLYGEQDYLKKQYRDKLRDALLAGGDAMNLSYYEDKEIDVAELIDFANTIPFFAPRRVVVVTDSGFFKSSQEALADFISALPDTAALIFVEKDVDKRTKTYKAITKVGRAVDFKMPDDAMLAAWVRGRLRETNQAMTEEAYQELLERCGDSMDAMNQELEKLIAYAYGREKITLSDVTTITTKQTQANVFEMISLMAAKRLPESLDLLYEMLAAKEPPIKIMALIIRQFQQMYQIKDLEAQHASLPVMAERMGTRDFILRKNIPLAHNFTMEEIRSVLEDAAEYDEASKNGTLNDRLAVEMLLTKWGK